MAIQKLIYYILAIAVLMGAGCGHDAQPYTDTSQDPEAYARSVKELAMTQAGVAKNSQEPADELRGLVAELEQTDRPRGTYDAVYSDLLSKASAIVAECEQATGKPSGIDQRLDELAATAEKLPGDVTSNRPTGD